MRAQSFYQELHVLPVVDLNLELQILVGQITRLEGGEFVVPAPSGSPRLRLQKA